jgi:hypothetical protein
MVTEGWETRARDGRAKGKDGGAKGKKKGGRLHDASGPKSREETPKVGIAAPKRHDVKIVHS